VTNKNLQHDHCSSICNALMMITGAIKTFATCHLYRFHWPLFSSFLYFFVKKLISHYQVRRQRERQWCLPSPFEICAPHFTFGPSVAPYIQYSIFEMCPPFCFFGPPCCYILATGLATMQPKLISSEGSRMFVKKSKNYVQMCQKGSSTS